MTNDFLNQFRKIFENDKSFMESWLVAWDYQNKRSKQKSAYKNEQPSDFFNYNGPADLPKWMRWFMPEYTDYLPKEITAPLLAKSLETDTKIISGLGLQYDFSSYAKNVGINNVHDYLFPNFYPVPERNRIKNIIDFGAGYGRQANLWASGKTEGIFLGMDAIPNSYCLQNLYYHQLGRPVYDYVEDPKSFKIDSSKSGIYHLPTWRYDLLPDNTFDLIMFVQVLPELNSKLIRTMMKVFHRVLKPGGAIYIRDHASIWKPAGKMDVAGFLAENGFVLEFQPHLILDGDIHGIPRIWRKIDPEVQQSQTRTFEHKKQQLVEDLDSLTGGALKSIVKKIKSK
ncbi:MAG: class I SAM-dependent methyltransferase [Bacteroidia bacterium]